MKTYMNDTNYSVVHTNENTFKIVDRNLELLSSKVFDTAAEAIDYAFRNFSDSKLLEGA